MSIEIEYLKYLKWNSLMPYFYFYGNNISRVIFMYQVSSLMLSSNYLLVNTD